MKKKNYSRNGFCPGPPEHKFHCNCCGGEHDAEHASIMCWCRHSLGCSVCNEYVNSDGFDENYGLCIERGEKERWDKREAAYKKRGWFLKLLLGW